jgi:hypothetical protein
MMALDKIINEENVLRMLRERVTQEMQVAAEPLVRETVNKLEAVMRRRLAEIVVAMVATEIDVFRDGRNLLIRLQTEPKK